MGDGPLTDYGQAGPFAVDISDGEWQDTKRNRRLFWRRYQPLALDGTPPTPALQVLHSHGLGGSCASGADWLGHWASWGITAVAIQHPGTDEKALASGSPLALRHLLRTAVDASQLANRQHDLLYALDRIAEEAPAALGISGHSYGAVSALRLIGERRGRDDLPADPRLAAAILFSPSARGGSLPLAERFAPVTLPCLHLSGSRDNGIGPGDISAADRTLPFQHMHDPGQYLLQLENADHRSLSGQGHGSDTHTRQLQAASTAFWLAYLAADAEAASRLHEALSKIVTPGDTLEQRC
jgi:predicted dienelactone hydrolase